MADFLFFTDRVGTTPGTPLDEAHLNVPIKARSYVLYGGTVTLGGGVGITMPETGVVVNSGSAAAARVLASQGFTLGANNDTYFDAAMAGTWNTTAVAVGAAAPAVSGGATSVRACKITTQSSVVTACVVYNRSPFPQLASFVSYGGSAGYVAASYATWAYGLFDVTLTTYGDTRLRIEVVGAAAAATAGSQTFWADAVLDSATVGLSGGATIGSGSGAGAFATLLGGSPERLMPVWLTDVLPGGSHRVRGLVRTAGGNLWTVSQTIIAVKELW